MTVVYGSLRMIGGYWQRADAVWLTLALLFAALVLFAPDQAGASFVFTMQSFLWLLPFLCVSVLLAAYLKAAGADGLIALVISERPATAILLAALAGAFSPFCSCGVVPLVASLLAAGVPLSAVAAFWLSSPLMDPEMFVLMSVQLPFAFVSAKVLAALGAGLLAGFATLAMERAGLLRNPMRKAAAGATCGSGCKGLGKVELAWAFWREEARRRSFAGEAQSVGLFLAKWMLLAFALESLMVAWIPGDLVASTLGGEGWETIVVATLVGVPAYLNGYAAIPLIGGLMESGMAPGPALAFMIAGGVTSLPAATAVFAVARLGVFFWYLVLALTVSLASGFLYQLYL